jgi:hypothetical protein
MVVPRKSELKLSFNDREFLADHARPYLSTLHGESKDYTYINAAEIDGFARKSEFIVTEWPKAQTSKFYVLYQDRLIRIWEFSSSINLKQENKSSTFVVNNCI